MHLEAINFNSFFIEGMDSITKDDHYDLILEKFADNIDSKIQNKLMTDLMIKYAELSKNFEEKNRLLLENEKKLYKYNQQLEELVDEKVKEISESQMATIFALVNLAESRDDDTGAHIERTSIHCKRMAQYLRKLPEYENIIDDNYIDNIFKASPLHDIGKVGIPDKILLKPGRLTGEEFEIMKTHVDLGYKTLSEVENAYPGNSFLKMGMDITRYHHEKWDGSGYPQGLKGKGIPLSARIMAIVDVYDALRSKRVYKEAFDHKRSMEIIKSSSGAHFDPVLVQVFMENNSKFEQNPCTE